MIVILVGPPGAGKGTQCKKLVEQFDMKHLSSGDIFRSEIAGKTDLGQKAKQHIDKGELVPDELVIDMMISAVKNADYNCILDGFPRTLPQAEQLDKALEKENTKIDAVIELAVNDETVVQRISKRRVCPDCGAVYHLETMPPMQDGICDKCGSKIIQRDDDKREVVLERLETYHKMTEPIISHYKDASAAYIEIDGSQRPEAITNDIAQRLKEA
ncbi:adenylate kinase [Sedimentisphaera salicampi]|uniref:Adenylate kinase n=1 Tax=Sedimentisphaera salicampi TaxID=1941349 RepID=A0A1W6LPG2_9BACT|nr:adenylate kinase [Sedimentisphaera salicampi]ARN57669.1 Adenylate kinase [Sedimentisphaera salicampi]OXU14234.1 Adenylate kinase [Sedimentisphaera salicampi]